MAFAALARSLGANAALAEATDTINQYQTERMLNAVRSRLEARARVAILGFSYKPETGVIEESQGVALAERLLAHGYEVVGYDPKALAAAAAALGNQIQVAPSADACVRAADLVVVMTPWPEFTSIPAEAFARKAKAMTVIDCWRLLPAEVGALANVVFVGHGGEVLAASAV